MWHVTCDMWQVTHDTCCVTHGRLREVNFLSKFQLPTSYRLRVRVYWRYIHKGWLNELISDRSVCRTATATPGLLIKSKTINANYERGNVSEEILYLNQKMDKICTNLLCESLATFFAHVIKSMHGFKINGRYDCSCCTSPLS